MRARWFCIVLFSFAGLSGCASLPQSCVPPAEPMISAEMLFGRKIGNRIGVSELAFAQFVAAEVTPRFPDGLTIVDARGQWRDGRGTIVREPSKVLLLTFHDDADKRASLEAVAAAYKQRFHQESVLTTVRPVCTTF